MAPNQSSGIASGQADLYNECCLLPLKLEGPDQIWELKGAADYNEAPDSVAVLAIWLLAKGVTF